MNQTKRARSKSGQFVKWEKCSTCQAPLGVGVSDDGEVVTAPDAYWAFSDGGDYLCRGCEKKEEAAAVPA